MTDHFGFAPDPENPGWYRRPAWESGRFNDIFGPLLVRADSATVARIRFEAGPQHRNLTENAHGGFLLGLIDHAYFVGPAVLGVRDGIGGVTIDSATQFFAPVAVGRPADVIVELLRETGRMLFVRGLIEQDGTACVSFSGTLRKASQRQPAA